MLKLWPQPLPVIGITGEYNSGKTLFGLSIAPQSTLVFDLEKSSESYQSLGFDRVDMGALLTRRFPRGHKPLDLWTCWHEQIMAVQPGKYRVIMVDPINDLESGLIEWVRQNSGHFGRTPAQYYKMAGILWGDVKEHWKAVLTDLASRCETFVFTTHMGNVWTGDRPSGKRKPKGKDTLMELASLYLLMERKPLENGTVPAVPSAAVLKSRLAHVSLAGGQVVIRPILPPRLPVATPGAIREYCQRPADYSNLLESERLAEERLSEDERAALRLAAAEAEAEVLRLRAEAGDRSQPHTPNAEPQAAPQPEKATQEQLATLKKYRDLLYEVEEIPQEDRARHWQAAMAKRGVATARDLTRDQADELISLLAHRLNLADLQALEDGRPQSEEIEETANFRDSG